MTSILMLLILRLQRYKCNNNCEAPAVNYGEEEHQLSKYLKGRLLQQTLSTHLPFKPYFCLKHVLYQSVSQLFIHHQICMLLL